MLMPALRDAEPRQHPRELEVAIGLDHNDAVRAARRQSRGHDAGDVVPREAGAHNDNVVRALRGGCGARGEGLQTDELGLDGAPELGAEEDDGEGGNVGVQAEFSSHLGRVSFQGQNETKYECRILKSYFGEGDADQIKLVGDNNSVISENKPIPKTELSPWRFRGLLCFVRGSLGIGLANSKPDG